MKEREPNPHRIEERRAAALELLRSNVEFTSRIDLALAVGYTSDEVAAWIVNVTLITAPRGVDRVRTTD